MNVETHLIVKQRHAFGRIDLLPVNETAQFFCSLLNKPNLPMDAVLKLKKAGYTIEEQIVPISE